ncbi:Transcription factor bHLH47 [Acorus calamus]|uniref:Transcription factor bHLH47 n=1 Tax=Acorus calamus TaxID=4465 RepID=A0AAV9CLH8_ACOCL|nr:Transcription factor bHLH47 [Acorus calamus]
MVPGMPLSMSGGTDAVDDDAVGRTFANKKNHGKVPRKIHKAEREKLKRDHLNELFLDLGHALEPARQNNGKASILGDTTKFLRDMLVQVESLRKENAALLSESHYVTVENNELKDEKDVLEAEVERLRKELQKRLQSDATSALPQSAATSVLQQSSQHLQPQPPPVVGPVYVIPLSRDPPQTYTEAQQNPPTPPKPPSLVTKPRARYPAPSDSWPLQLLVSRPRVSEEGQTSGGDCGGSANTSTTESG